MTRPEAPDHVLTPPPTLAEQENHTMIYSLVTFAVAGVLAVFCSCLVDGGYGNLGAFLGISVGGVSLFILSLSAGVILRKRYRTISMRRIMVVSFSAPISSALIVGFVLASNPASGVC